jgi:FkbM family methyltransferase
LPPILSRLPAFRGKGRLTLLADAVVTDLGSESSYLVVGKINGEHRMHFDLRSWSQKFAYYYRELERERIAVFRDMYQGGLFLDVGSSVGLYSICMSDKVRRAGERIVAVEPVPANLERQRMNFELNGIDDLVDVYPIALGADPGMARIVSDPTHADNNAFVNSSGDLEVSVARLDELALGWKRIGAMKIDIEGFEPAMLRGARATITRDRPIIYAEFNRERMAINGFDMVETWAWFRQHGYRLFRLDSALVPLDDPAEYEDLFLVPREVGLP